MPPTHGTRATARRPNQRPTTVISQVKPIQLSSGTLLGFSPQNCETSESGFTFCERHFPHKAVLPFRIDVAGPEYQEGRDCRRPRWRLALARAPRLGALARASTPTAQAAGHRACAATREDKRDGRQAADALLCSHLHEREFLERQRVVGRRVVLCDPRRAPRFCRCLGGAGRDRHHGCAIGGCWSAEFEC
jgi:hypothetical protein